MKHHKYFVLAVLGILLVPVATISQAQAAEQAVPIEVAPDKHVPDDAT